MVSESVLIAFANCSAGRDERGAGDGEDGEAMGSAAKAAVVPSKKAIAANRTRKIMRSDYPCRREIANGNVDRMAFCAKTALRAAGKLM